MMLKMWDKVLLKKTDSVDSDMPDKVKPFPERTKVVSNMSL